MYARCSCRGQPARHGRNSYDNRRPAMQLHARGEARSLAGSVVGRIATSAVPPEVRKDHILLLRDEVHDQASDYLAVLSVDAANTHPGPGVFGVAPLAYLDAGDVVALYPSGVVQVYYRHGSVHNSILVTE